MASNSRGLGTIDNPITRDVLSSNSHCDLDSATVPFSGTSLAQKPLQQGVNGQQMGTIAGIAFLMKKKTMGCDCQHFFFFVRVSPPPLIQSLFTNCQLQHRTRCLVWALFLAALLTAFPSRQFDANFENSINCGEKPYRFIPFLEFM